MSGPLVWKTRVCCIQESRASGDRDLTRLGSPTQLLRKHDTTYPKVPQFVLFLTSLPALPHSYLPPNKLVQPRAT